MSSPPSSTTPSPTTYWCHDCDMSILLSTPPFSPPPPRCPHCQNCFLEHMDAFPPLATTLHQNSIWASSNSPPPHNFLLNRPYLHRLIHHLSNSAEAPTMNPSSARASKGVVEGLKRVRIEGDLGEFCSICKDQFRGDGGLVANELPCGHVFHNGCIVPWLEINNTCPLCRFRLESEEDGEGEGEGEVGGEYIGAMRLDELLDDGDDEGDYENEFRELMRIERGGNQGGRVMFSATQIGEAGTGGVVDRANSVETVSSWPVWQAEGEREVGTSDVENVVRA